MHPSAKAGRNPRLGLLAGDRGDLADLRD